MLQYLLQHLFFQKSSKKKRKTIDFGLSSENILKPDVKRRLQNETHTEELTEPEYVISDILVF